MDTEKIRALTPYPDINNLLADWTEKAKNILGENVVGLYLSGSLSYGDLVPERRYPFGNRSLTQPFTPHRTYRPLSDHSVSAIARDCRACSRYSLHRYSIYFLGGIRWWILFRLNCSNYKLVLKPGAPTANTSGKRSLMNSEARRWKCSGLTRLRLFIGS